MQITLPFAELRYLPAIAFINHVKIVYSVFIMGLQAEI